MFDKLEDLVKRLDEVMQELSEPDVVSDQNRFRNLMKEQNELAPIVEKYKEYKEAKQTIEDSVEMLEEEHDEEMRELLKEELSEAKKNVEQYEEELKVLLLPKVREWSSPCTAYPCNRVRRTYPYFYNHSSNHARSRRSRCTA